MKGRTDHSIQEVSSGEHMESCQEAEMCPLKAVCAHMVHENLYRHPGPRHTQSENGCSGERSMKLGTGNCGLHTQLSPSPPALTSQGCSCFSVCWAPPLGVEMVPSHHVSEVRNHNALFTNEGQLYGGGSGDDVSNCEDSVREIPVGQKGSFPAGLDTCSPWGLVPGAGRGGRRQDPPAPGCPRCVVPAASLQGPRVDT